MHRMWTAARKEDEFLAYRVAIPLQRLRWRNVFSTKCLSL